MARGARPLANGGVAEMTGILLPNGRQQFVDINGEPLVGGKVYFYTAQDLVTPKDTYQNAALTIPNTNPVVLDARGQAIIFGSGYYWQVLKDALGNTIWTGELAGNAQTSAEVTFLQSGAGAVTRTVQAVLRENHLSALDFGADNTGATDTVAALQLMSNEALASGKRMFMPPGIYKIGSRWNIEASELVMHPGAQIRCDAADATTWTNGALRISGGAKVFGGTIYTTGAALSSNGTLVSIVNGELDGVTLWNQLFTGIAIAGPARVANCVVNGGGYRSVLVALTAAGTVVLDSVVAYNTGVLYVNKVWSGVVALAGRSFFIASSFGTTSKFQILNCESNYVYGSALWVSDPGSPAISNVLIDGFKSSYAGYYVDAGGTPIQGSQSGTAIELASTAGAVVQNCVVYAPLGYCLANFYSNDAVLVNNVLTGTLGDPIIALGASDRVIVQGNVLRNGTTGVILGDNDLNPRLVPCNDCQIIGNTFIECTDGAINFMSGDGLLVMNNTIVGGCDSTNWTQGASSLRDAYRMSAAMANRVQSFGNKVSGLITNLWNTMTPVVIIGTGQVGTFQVGERFDVTYTEIGAAPVTVMNAGAVYAANASTPEVTLLTYTLGLNLVSATVTGLTSGAVLVGGTLGVFSVTKPLVALNEGPIAAPYLMAPSTDLYTRTVTLASAVNPQPYLRLIAAATGSRANTGSINVANTTLTGSTALELLDYTPYLSKPDDWYVVCYLKKALGMGAGNINNGILKFGLSSTAASANTFALFYLASQLYWTAKKIGGLNNGDWMPVVLKLSELLDPADAPYTALGYYNITKLNTTSLILGGVAVGNFVVGETVNITAPAVGTGTVVSWDSATSSLELVQASVAYNVGGFDCNGATSSATLTGGTVRTYDLTVTKPVLMNVQEL